LEIPKPATAAKLGQSLSKEQEARARLCATALAAISSLLKPFLFSSPDYVTVIRTEHKLTNKSPELALMLTLLIQPVNESST
jgi:hypothetical protein